jgi:hypothetical protein
LGKQSFGGENFVSTELPFAIVDEEGTRIPQIENNRPYFLQEQQKKKKA